jgi:hypothetical protein
MGKNCLLTEPLFYITIEEEEGLGLFLLLPQNKEHSLLFLYRIVSLLGCQQKRKKKKDLNSVDGK